MEATETKQKIVEHPEFDPSTGFDYRTHIKDAKTGKLIRIQTYARHARSGEVLLERPVGSGNCFSENGEPAGRWNLTKWEKISDDHIAVKAAPANREEDLEQRNAILERELAALKAESQMKQQRAPEQTHKK